MHNEPEDSSANTATRTQYDVNTAIELLDAFLASNERTSMGCAVVWFIDEDGSVDRVLTADLHACILGDSKMVVGWRHSRVMVVSASMCSISIHDPRVVVPEVRFEGQMYNDHGIALLGRKLNSRSLIESAIRRFKITTDEVLQLRALVTQPAPQDGA